RNVPMAMARMAEMKARDSSVLLIRTASSFDGMGLVGVGLGRAARFAPLPVVLVPPKNLLDHGIDDVIRVALDEPSVIFEEFVDRLLEFYFPSHDPWCFLNDRHSVPPLLM